MPYIGSSPTQAAFVTDSFSGNGSTTAFTMSVAPANTASVLVAISGVLQDPSTYSVSGTTLTFSAAPPTGTGNISARYLGIPASGVTTTAYRTVTEFTATANQTTFTPPSYTVGFISVYRNGVLLGSADYTATNGTTVVLATGATAGDLITTQSFYVSSVLNAIPATAGSVGSTYLANGAVGSSQLASNLTLGGVTSMPSQISFTSYTNGTGSFATTNSVITFTNVLTNIGNCYNPSTGRFTATVAGRYLFTAALMATGTGRYYFNLRKNGQNYAQAGGESSNYLLTPICYIITLAVGDYMDVYITTGTLYAASTLENYFTGHLLG